MANPPIPAITQRAPTIDFIDQRLPKHHPAFASQLVQYDAMAKRYVPIGQASGPNTSNSLVNTGGSSAPSSSTSLNQRPEWTEVSAMRLWNNIFPDAMARFKSTPPPQGRSGTAYDIRDKSDWQSVYDTLESAREKYQDGQGARGVLKKFRRTVADSIAPGAEAAKIAAKMTPQDNVATPVLGVVEVLFTAVKNSSSVRKQVLSSFDDLVSNFSDVELFLSTFQGDAYIRSASIELTTATLEAVERAITFFISKYLLRVGKALLSGEDYESSLVGCIQTMKMQSTNLLEQAHKSHIYTSQMESKQHLRLQEQQAYQLGTVLSGVNSIEQLLRDHLNQRDELEAARKENINLKVENGILRSTSPMQISMWLPPPPPNQRPALDWYIRQDTLRQIVDASDIDIADMAFIIDRKEQIPTKERSRAEQAINTSLFRNWIVSPTSSKLLIHSEHSSKKVAEVSSLSVFCMTMAQTLRAKDRFLSSLWFCGQHVDVYDPNVRTGGRAMLSSLIDQLLRQFEFDTAPLHGEIDLESLQAVHIDVLIKLLNFLVYQLPSMMTVFFIIDGVVLFEREQFETDALPVFSSLVRLADDTSVAASVKLLFTSTPGTNIVRGAFEPENLILNVDALPLTGLASEERMIRELDGGLNENEGIQDHTW